MATKPHWTGSNVKSTWFLDNEKIKVDVMSVDINAVGTKVADAVCGENRTRNDFILDHFEGTMAVQQIYLEAIRALLKIQDNRDSKGAALQTAIGFRMEFNDGTKTTVTVQDITFDDWKWAWGGRDRNKVTIPFRANQVKEI